MYQVNFKKEKGLFSFFIRCNVILYQLYKGFRMMRTATPCVTVFGSARIQEGHPYYSITVEIGKTIAQAGYTTVTGGGPGLMEAANRGAFENGGKSYGCSIQLEYEQYVNPYVHHFFTFDYFFIRKVMLINFSVAYIILPGGFGTADELFNVITLIQTEVIQKRPVIIYDSNYHTHIKLYFDDLLDKHLISVEDLDFIHFIDSHQTLSEFLTNNIILTAKEQTKLKMNVI